MDHPKQPAPDYDIVRLTTAASLSDADRAFAALMKQRMEQGWRPQGSLQYSESKDVDPQHYRLVTTVRRYAHAIVKNS